MTDNALKIIKDELERINNSIMLKPGTVENLTKALSVAVSALEYYTNENLYDGVVYRSDGRSHSEFADEALNTIANILSGEKDGK